MKTIRAINVYAFIFCLLLYITCYFRFFGQGVLTVIEVISAIIITLQVFSKTKYNSIKKHIKIFWLVIISNAIILFSFFHTIMWNDFLQVLFVTLIPNITAFYFIKILIKIEDLS